MSNIGDERTDTLIEELVSRGYTVLASEAYNRMLAAMERMNDA